MDIKNMVFEIKVPNNEPNGALNTTEVWIVELKN